MILNLVTILVSIFIFSFALWRRLKEDYQESQIFYLTLLLLSGGGIGIFLASKFLDNYLLWSFIGGLTLAGLYGAKKLKFKTFEVVDAVVPGFLWLMLAVYPAYLLKEQLPILISEASILIISLTAYYFFIKNFRKFYWYPSGKIGFAGLATLAILFIGRIIIAFYAGMMISSLGQKLPEIALSISIVLMCIVTLYLLSGRQDFKKFLPKT